MVVSPGAKAAGDTTYWDGFKGDGSLIKEYTVVSLAGLTLALLVLCGCFRGMKSLKVVVQVGIAMFIMSILYVVMAVTAPALQMLKLRPLTSPLKAAYSHIDFTYITTISMLVCGWWGREDPPYVNQTRNQKRISEGDALFLAVMVAVCAILGSSWRWGMMFDSGGIYPTI
ncbi:hypothetical protein KCP76_19155 [Salmonella enterica subsp. enterica serovar Weltevreden]|nr:hypothetical protein KCP76_19155 [Salmonella enterica subsp. enterica serovar Weltevreden]